MSLRTFVRDVNLLTLKIPYCWPKSTFTWFGRHGKHKLLLATFVMQVIESNPPNADYVGDIESVHISYKKSNTNQYSCPDYGLYTNLYGTFWFKTKTSLDLSQNVMNWRWHYLLVCQVGIWWMVESEMLRPSLKIKDIFLRQNFQTPTNTDCLQLSYHKHYMCSWHFGHFPCTVMWFTYISGRRAHLTN